MAATEQCAGSDCLQQQSAIVRLDGVGHWAAVLWSIRGVVGHWAAGGSLVYAVKVLERY